MVMTMKTAVFWDVMPCSLVVSRHVPHKCWHLSTFQRNVPRGRKPTYTASHSKIASESHTHMLSSLYISCFSSNGCPLGFYALWVLTFQRNALPPSSVDWIGPGGWWSDRVEKPTTLCNHTTSAATWTNSDMLKMEAIFSSKTVKQSSPHGVKTQMKILIYVFSMAYVIQHWAFQPNLDL
jgi:hypothetical protein